MKIRNTMKIRNYNSGKQARHANSRQGITLLFVVSMIVLFLLMGTAFVVVSNDFFRASRPRLKAKIYTVDRTALVHRTFYNIVRGPDLADMFSPFRGHDLLSDQYGFGLRAYVNYAVDVNGDQSSPIAVTAEAAEQQLGYRLNNLGHQYIQIALASEVTNPSDPLPTGGNPLADANEYWPLHNPAEDVAPGFVLQSDVYTGSVFTFVSGPAQGLSTRIARHKYNAADQHHYFWITPVWADRGPVTAAQLQDSQVVINGHEFGGIGAGSFVDGTTVGGEALLPNRVGTTLDAFRTEYMGSSGGGGAEAGTPWHCFNESYDAADYQNMFLSGRNSAGEIIPSFHRHKLYEFIWENTTNPDQTAATAQANFRPRAIDILDNNTGMVTPDGDGDGVPDGDGLLDPLSTANNFYPYNLGAGSPAQSGATLDCDTDLDGTNDAVFIDPGYDIITNPDGTRYKPLVAIRVVDLDGRFNLNAHSNLTQTRADRFINTFSTQYGTGAALPPGEGFGPAEINLGALFQTGPPAARVPDYGAVNSIVTTRYGSDGIPGGGLALGKSNGKLIGHPMDTVDVANGQFGTLDRDAAYAVGQFGQASSRTLFASSPMNIHGRFGVMSPDFARINIGSNVYNNFGDPNINTFSNALPVIDMYETGDKTLYEFANNPYEMSFAPYPFGDGNDAPYTARELERIYRQYDPDVGMLPARLWNAPGANWWMSAGENLGELVTTESYEVPRIPRIFKELLIDRLQEKGIEATLAAAETRAELFSNPSPTANPYYDLFAPELWQGLRMDVNRPFGNGWDDNGDGVVDNPAETAYSDVADARSERNWEYYNGTDDTFNPEMDLDNDHETNSTSARDGFVQDPRVRFAKHLYMLALLLTDEVDVDLDGDGTPDAGSYEQMIAQWAVNVADFRDPDNIMTYFQYDPNPWDGWNPSAEVWGVERPELLISESISGHARRTEDLGIDDMTTGTAPDQDEDFDQGLRPEAFAFIELYNPWTQNRLNQRFDSTLYNNNGLQLNRLTPSANGPETPVWRIRMDRPESLAVGGVGGGVNQARPMRYVYFVDPDTAGSDVIAEPQEDSANVEVFFSSLGITELPPGAHAVIGTYPDNPTNEVFLGRLAGKGPADELAANGLELDQTRRIAMDHANDEITVYQGPVATGQTRSAVIVPIDRARPGSGGTADDRRFSASDPFQGYPNVDANGTPGIPIPAEGGLRYTAPYDEPRDLPGNTDRNRNDNELAKLYAADGMTKQFRVIHLQRLANPLKPFNRITNPYRTIDVFDMDLIVFNGAAAGNEAGGAVPIGGGAGGASFATTRPTPDRLDTSLSLERGRQDNLEDAANVADGEYRELWRSARGANIDAGTAGTSAAHYFNFDLIETLGRTNDYYAGTDAITNGNKPYPMLSWNNRPFVNHLELTNVTFASTEWLTRNFTTQGDKETSDSYDGVDDVLRGQFRHLFNFYAHDDSATPDRANLFRLFDYLEVPSPFLGTEARMNSNQIVNHPFNVLPRYRVPGKINLNTIYNDPGNAGQSRIWAGLQNGYQNFGEGLSWAEFRNSRDGDAADVSPTDFINPFRPAGTGDNVPDINMALYGTAAATDSLQQDEPNTTLFRSDGNPTTEEPLFDFDSTTDAYDAERSAYFRNIQRNRLANLTTTRSSVFAIWITVAYFEVDENLRIGAEVGADRGEAVRNRGFYIYDRSIPVGHEPGENHNIERGILAQSIIE